MLCTAAEGVHMRVHELSWATQSLSAFSAAWNSHAALLMYT